VKKTDLVIIIAVIGFLFTSSIYAQTYEWVKGISGGYGGNAEGNAVTIDTYGNSLTTGWFGNTAKFGTISITSYGSEDIFIAKFDKTGNSLWVKKAGGSLNDFGNGISTDAAGNIYITGSFRDTANFDTITLTSFGWNDFFIAKYDNSGNCVWAKRGGDSKDDFGNGIYTDSIGNSFVTGKYDTAVFIAKYDNSGNCLWIKHHKKTTSAANIKISCDAKGNSYILGRFNTSISFDTITVFSFGHDDIFIAKFDSVGNCLWVKHAGGPQDDWGLGISTDPDGKSYITGSYYNMASFDSTKLTGDELSDVFLAKYDNTGKCLWAKKGGGPSWDMGSAIFIDASGNSYITGNFMESATFDTMTVVTNGYIDIFIAKYKPSGICEWVRKAGGYGTDQGNGITASANGEVYFTGKIGGTANFGILSIAANGGYLAKITNYSTQLDDIANKPQAFDLSQNYPNPFNPTTTFTYQLAVGCKVSLKIYDILGTEITTLVDEEKESGKYQVEFNASSLPSGIYFYKLNAGEFSTVKKFVLMK